MATYNDKLTYLTKAVDSILNQTYKNIEFIIVDDSNNKETIEYLLSLPVLDNRVKVIHNEEKQGFVKSLNIGLMASKGVYIARMDSDDISISDRIEKQVSYLNNNEKTSILGAGITIINEDGKVTGKRKYKSSFEDLKKVMFFRSPVAHPTIMFRKSIIDSLGVYDEAFKMSEDYELWLRAVKKGLIIENLEDYLLEYRMVTDYHKKRNHRQWKYNLRAKVKNFNTKFLVTNSLGILLAISFMIAPSFVINKLYTRDREKPLIYGE